MRTKFSWSKMRFKKLLKKLIPGCVLNFYRKVNMSDYKIKYLEEEIKNRWLNERAEESKNQKENFRRKEFKIFSQTGEDGVIDYIFKKIGVKNKKFVEIGIEDGRECNTANLSLNFGWSGLLIEANKSDAEKAKKYYLGKPVKVINSFVKKENINEILKRENILGEIDLLSIDIDGNDYWIWETINEISPRVVIVEYNSTLRGRDITIKYNPAFSRFTKEKTGYYYGTSLSALTKLAEKKGYALVACNSLGFNSFFVKKSELKGLKKLSPEEADYKGISDEEVKKRFEKIKHLPFQKN